MDELSTSSNTFKAELASVIIYLSQGPVEVKPKSDTLFQLKKKGAPCLDVSVQALVYLARKAWVKRDGKYMRITTNAPSQIGTAARATLPAELIENGETRTVTRVAAESPIDYLAVRKDKSGNAMLGKAEWSAGDRLRTDFTRANMLPGIGMRWGEPIRSSGGAGGGVTQTDAAMAARMRVTKALEAVGPEFSGLLIDVCCFLKGLEQVETERGWPQRSAKVMLRAGLSILARHYSPGVKSRSTMRAWGAPDYRPSL